MHTDVGRSSAGRETTQRRLEVLSTLLPPLGALYTRRFHYGAGMSNTHHNHSLELYKVR